MSVVYVIIFSVLVILSIIFSAIALFNDGWFSLSVPFYSDYEADIGIVPYPSGQFVPDWLQALSVLMYFVFSLDLIILLLAGACLLAAFREEYYSMQKTLFAVLAILCFLTCILGIVVFIIAQAGAANFEHKIVGLEVDAGSSVYLELVASIFIIVAGALAAFRFCTLRKGE